MNGFIDWKISIGTLLHLIVLSVVLVGCYWRMRELVFRLHNIAMNKIQELHADNVAKISALEVRFAVIESTAQRLSRIFEGFEWMKRRVRGSESET